MKTMVKIYELHLVPRSKYSPMIFTLPHTLKQFLQERNIYQLKPNKTCSTRKEIEALELVSRS